MTALFNQVFTRGQNLVSNAEPRQRILLVAHCFDAKFSMESRLSWFRATIAARQYDVTVVCAAPYDEVRCNLDAQVPGMKVVAVPHTPFEKRLIKTPIGFYLAYRMWHRRVLRVAKQLHSKAPFSLVHQVSYCGYREPGYCLKLGVPFVWGPIGGTQNVPWRFLRQLGPLGAMKEAFRTVANGIQLRLDGRVGRALRSASAVFVANREIQDSFRRARGLELPCQLETGVDQIADEPRPLRDPSEPLRVLWAGRLESWKALPLLLKAVAQLPPEVALELRVLGSGSRERYVKQLAEKLGVSHRIDWVALPECGIRDEHYQWADAFAFTSLRDTSGTGLLESLAAGVPIIGLDHQGARDIMTDDCALRIPVETPQQVISAMRDALLRLADDPELQQQLSAGALDRVRQYHWNRLGAQMLASYAEVLRVPGKVQPKTNYPQQFPVPQTTSAVG